MCNSTKGIQTFSLILLNCSGEVDHQHRSESSALAYVPWYILYGVICVPTIIGNSLILRCLSKFRDNRSSIHVLIGNLAVSDLIVGAILLPYCMVTDALDLNSVKYFCLTKASLMVFAIGSTCYGLLLVSIDRFSCVCFPFRHYRTFSTKKIVGMLVFGWSYVGTIAFLPLSGWNFYDRNLPYKCQEDLVLTPIYQKVMNGNFIVILSINLILYIIVIRISMKKAGKIYSQQACVYDYRINVREFYKVKTMAMVQGLFAVCWFPYVVLAIVISFSDIPVLHEIQYWSLIPGFFNCSVNWLIYGYRNKQLRKQMKVYLKCYSFFRRRQRSVSVL